MNGRDQTTTGFGLLKRREYLKYTGAITGELTASTGMVAAGIDDDSETTLNSVTDVSLIDLAVEYAENPLGVATAQPRFSWNVSPGVRSWEQQSYRILVASSKAKLNADTGDVWDSERVVSAQSTNVEHRGETLESGERYYWKVRVWEEDGKASAWSETAYFELGLLSEDEWTTEWIGSQEKETLPGVEWTNYTFETEFILDQWAAGIIFRAQDAENLYMWQINTRVGPPTKLRPHIRENGQWRTLEPIVLDDVLGDSPHQRHYIAIDLRGSEITTYIDGQHVDTRSDATHTAGTIGFRQDGPEHSRFDNVRVTTPTKEVLFADDFSDTRTRSFSGGTITDGMLDVQDDGIVLLGGDQSNPGPLLRNKVTLEKEVADARAYISGLGFYNLYINGEHVGDQVLDPGRTDYEETVLYATHDITGLLRAGPNVIGVALGRGRYGELLSSTFEWANAPWWSDPELRIQIDVRFADGTSTVIGSDETWKVADGPVRFDSLYGGEIYDAREERSGWATADYDDADWEQAAIVDGPAGELISQQVQPITITDTIEPVKITKPEADTYVYDFGQMMAGWAELTVEGPAGTEVKMSLGEKVTDDGTVYNENHHIPGEMQVDRYILSGDGTETWEPEFTYNGFRYVQLEGFPGTPTLDTLEAKVVHSAVDVDSESQFSSSNELINQIHENTRWAMLNNMHSVPEDTPAREKNAYGADAQVVAEAAIYNFSMPRFYSKWLRDWADSQRSDGQLPTTAPNAGDWTYNQGGPVTPGWGSAYVFISWWLYQYYGDREVIKEHYAGLKRYVERLREFSDEYIIRDGLGDWNAPGGNAPPPEGPAITSTGYFYHDTKILSEIARILDRDKDATEFATLSEEIKAAFNAEFLDDDDVYRTGQVSEYRQTSNVFPLAVGLVPEEREDAVVKNLVKDIQETWDGHLNTGAIGTKYLLQVLTEYGHHDVAYTIATQTTYPSWGYWIEAFDATALFERWDESAGIFSRDHQYLGSIDEWFYQYLAGIREPLEPGFERIEIAPKPVDKLEQAEGTVETVNGSITSSWKRTETVGEIRTRDGLKLDVVIPGNTTAVVRVPTLGGDAVRVRESGKPIWNNGNRTRPNHPGIESVKRDGDVIVVEIGSGEYYFELDQLREAR